MKHYVYVLKSNKDQKLYTGMTSNLSKRIKEHNSGKNVSTKNRRPFKIIYQENYPNRLEARKREKWLKSGEGREFLKNNVNKYRGVEQFGSSSGS